MIDFEDMHVTTDSAVLNTMLEVFHFMVVPFLKNYENGYGAYFNQMVQEFNLLLKTKSKLFVPWPDKKHHKLNVSVMEAPDFDAETQIASIALDGTIYDSYLKTTHVDQTTTKANRKEDFKGSQIFIH